MEWTRILAYITGSVDQELLLRNEYLAAENRILRAKMNRRPQFSAAERATLGEIGFRLGRRALSEVATAAQPDTILAWYRRLVARKFDGSQSRRGPGRPRIDQDVEGLIVRGCGQLRPDPLPPTPPAEPAHWPERVRRKKKGREEVGWRSPVY
jgi:putative transposase